MVTNVQYFITKHLFELWPAYLLWETAMQGDTCMFYFLMKTLFEFLLKFLNTWYTRQWWHRRHEIGRGF